MSAETPSEQHAIKIERSHKLDTRNQWWQARCTCGYVSAPSVRVAGCDAAGQMHLRAKVADR